MNDDDLWYTPIRRQDHADQRILERVGPVDPVGEIRVALVLGRFSATRPLWIDGRPPRAEPYRVVYCWDETLTRCWVVRRTETCLYPMTVLLERRAWNALTERQRSVRSGSVRS